jgi:hypothetical protein
MLKRWQRLGWSTVLAAAFFTVATPAPAPAEEKPTDVQLERIGDQLKQVLIAIADIQQDIRTLKADAKANREATQGKIAALDQTLNRLLDDMVNLKRDLGTLREPGSNPAIRQAGGINPPGTPGTTGRVLLENFYYHPVRIKVNDRTYDLEPGQTHEIFLPAGVINYEVVGIGCPRTDTLPVDKPGADPYRIRVYIPR